MVSKFGAIATPTYEVSVAQATRASAPPAPIDTNPDDMPAVQVRHIRTQERFHVRGAYECRMQVDIVCIVEQSDETLADLIGAVKKVVEANEVWSDGTALAISTEILETVSHETEVAEVDGTAIVSVEVLFRVKVDDPYTVKAI